MFSNKESEFFELQECQTHVNQVICKAELEVREV